MNKQNEVNEKKIVEASQTTEALQSLDLISLKRELQVLHTKINRLHGLTGSEDVVVGLTTYTFHNGILVKKTI
jgi:hypothetical protein